MNPTVRKQLAAHLERNEWEAAATIYQAVLQSASDDAEAWHGFGVLAGQVGRFDVAVSSIERAIDLQPEVPEYQVSLAAAFRALHRLDDLVACLRRRVLLTSNDMEAHRDLARALADAGDPCGAILSYENALELRPDNAALHNDLGVLLGKEGKWQSAIAHFRQVVSLAPDFAAAYSNLGIALTQLERFDEAEIACRRALALDADCAEVHFNLGNILQAADRVDEATDCFENALERNPNYAEAHNNLGVILNSCGQSLEAAQHCRQALAIRADFPEAHYNLANALKVIGQEDEAIDAYCRAVELRANYPEAWNNLGVVLAGRDRITEAVVACQRAVELKPDEGEAHYNLGNAFRGQDELEKAAACYRRAIEFDGNPLRAHNNLGVVLQDLGQVEKGIACFRRAADIAPDDSGVRMNLAFALLLAGRLEEGWEELEWRRRTKKYAPRTFPQPEWSGEDLEGRTILLHSEQGFGDTIQFIRYGSEIKRRGAGRIVVQCQRPLLRLLTNCPWIDELAEERELPQFDIHAPLMSLPRLFGTVLPTIPDHVPYLETQLNLVETWQPEFAFEGTKIGLTWQGNPKHTRDRFRSIPLGVFEPLGDVPDIRLFSLQKGIDPETLHAEGEGLALVNLAPKLHDFAETAAALMHLDLVICCDSAVAHLAGALARPTWVLLPYSPDWRWLRGRSDSPWYPTIRLWRQSSPGDWMEVIDRVAHELWVNLNKRHKSPIGFCINPPLARFSANF
jgi:Flp pilus assembly protein TadD